MILEIIANKFVILHNASLVHNCLLLNFHYKVLRVEDSNLNMLLKVME